MIKWGERVNLFFLFDQLCNITHQPKLLHTNLFHPYKPPEASHCARRCVLSLSVRQAMMSRSHHFPLFIILFINLDLNISIVENAVNEAHVPWWNNKAGNWLADCWFWDCQFCGFWLDGCRLWVGWLLGFQLVDCLLGECWLGGGCLYDYEQVSSPI